MQSEPLRVLYTDHTSQLSGAELSLLRLIAALGPSVVPSVVVAEDGPLVERLRADDIDVAILPASSIDADVERGVGLSISTVVALASATARSVLRFGNELRARRPDVLHSNSLKAGLWWGPSAWLLGIPFVWHLHDRLADDYMHPSMRRVVQWAMSLTATWVIVNSESTAMTIGPVSRRKCSVIGSPISPRDRDREHGPARSLDDQPDRPVRLVMLGRLDEWKGQHVLIEAVGELISSGVATEVRLCGADLFGDGAYEASLRTQCERSGLASVVEFSGHVDDIDEQFDWADIVIHASVIPEPFGQVIVEAMAAGVPVVASRSGAPIDLCRDGAGALFTPGDACDLAATIASVWSDGERRAAMVSAGLDVAESFSPPVVAAQVADAYTAAIRQQRQRRRRRRSAAMIAAGVWCVRCVRSASARPAGRVPRIGG